jgi:signal transduction histidine kinase/CheY-like chemotaxis protein
MIKDRRNLSGWLYFALPVLLVVVFAVDWLTSLRVAIPVFYVLPVALAIWVDRPNVPFITAGIASALTLAGYWLANPDIAAGPSVLQIDRVIGVLVMFVLAGVGHLYIKTRLNLQRTYRERMVELLEKTERQGEKLQVQQEALRISNEELEERGRALKAGQARLEMQQTELRQTNVRVEEHAQDLDRQKGELQRAQEALKASALLLERASQYKSEFLANMSHELRTPLHSSLILAKLLQDNKLGRLSEEEVRYASTIHSSNSDLLSLINDILDLSTVEAGQMNVQFAPVSIDTLLQSLQQSFAPIADSKGLALVTEHARDVPPYFVTDNQRLRQVLRSLLSNAFKFTERGQVTVAVKKVDGEALRFDVRDTGIGIPHDKQDLIFQAFQQADGTTSRKYGGIGLGLSISREFSRLLGGSVSVTSEPGAGSVFSVTLPLAIREGLVTAKLDGIGHMGAFENEAEPFAELAAESASILNHVNPAPAHVNVLSMLRAARQRDDVFEGRTILLAEDDVRSIFSLSHVIEPLGARLEIARNGREALEVLAGHSPIDLVLMDNMMLEMDGFTAIGEIRKQSDHPGLPIIALMGKGMLSDRQRCLDVGADDTISKPIDVDKLVWLCREWLRKR